MLEEVFCAECGKPVKFSFIVLLCDPCLAKMNIEAKKKKERAEELREMQFNNDPKWLEKMAQFELENPCYVPLKLCKEIDAITSVECGQDLPCPIHMKA